MGEPSAMSLSSSMRPTVGALSLRRHTKHISKSQSLQLKPGVVGSTRLAHRLQAAQTAWPPCCSGTLKCSARGWPFGHLQIPSCCKHTRNGAQRCRLAEALPIRPTIGPCKMKVLTTKRISSRSAPRAFTFEYEQPILFPWPGLKAQLCALTACVSAIPPWVLVVVSTVYLCIQARLIP